MELLLGLAPRLRPNLGLGRYKLPRATYTIEAYVARGLGYDPRITGSKPVVFPATLSPNKLVPDVGTDPTT